MSRDRIAGFVPLLLAAAVLFPAGDANAAGPAWQSNLQRAAREAEQTRKPMLLKFTASWCKYCSKMDETSFANEQVAALVNECFIPVVVDADDNKELVRAVGVKLLPTTVVVSPKFEVIRKIAGYRNAEQLASDLDGLCEKRPAAKAEPKPRERRPGVQLASQSKSASGTGAAPFPVKAVDSRNSGGPAAMRESLDKPPFGRAENEDEPFARNPFDRATFEREKPETPRPASRSPFDDLPAGITGDPAVDRSVDRTVRQSAARPSERSTTATDAAKPAFGGCCLVTMLEDRRVRKGDGEHALYYRNQLLTFATQQCKRQFEANPRRYWPVNGGVCPVTAKAGDPKLPVIYRDQLWLCASPEHRRRFADDPSTYAGKAVD